MPKMLYFWTILTRGREPSWAMCVVGVVWGCSGGRDARSGKQKLKTSQSLSSVPEDPKFCQKQGTTAEHRPIS